MTDHEYRQTQEQLILLARFALNLRVEEMLRRIDTANTVAPIFDPMLWMRGHRRLDAINELARAARTFKAAAEKFRDDFIEIAVNEEEAKEAWVRATGRAP